MAFTPSKDYKRREREQKKAEKRMAREARESRKEGCRAGRIPSTSTLLWKLISTGWGCCRRRGWDGKSSI